MSDYDDYRDPDRDDDDSDRWRAPPVPFEDCEAIKETDAALLIEFPDGRKLWIPKSQIDDDSEVYDENEHAIGKLVLTAWIAKEKGLV